MTTINLVDPARSTIGYKISQFPDGQQQVTITKIDMFKAHTVKIISRLNNFSDVERIICTVASLRECGVQDVQLYVPYFLGGRSDRQFEVGSNNYLKCVICPIINALGFGRVDIIDPHSYVLSALINNVKCTDNTELVRFALNDLYGPNTEEDEFVIVTPDDGASKKIDVLVKKIGYTDQIIVCRKKRGADGGLSATEVPPAYRRGKDYLLIDDICDGGRTFNNIVDEINKDDPKARKILIVTHGIFSAGFAELKKRFSAIYCTNSFSDNPAANHPSLKNFVKQLNVML